jgi:DNA-binding CsgD family transcriptional regulator
MRANFALLRERDHELDVIDSAVKECHQGTGQLLLVEGAPGLGKTTVLAALRSRVEEEGFRVLTATSHELEREFPYGVIRQLFEGWLMSASQEERRHVLRGPAKLAAPLLDYGAQGPSVADGDDSQHAFLNGLYWMCVHLAERAPLALLLDDIWWADAASLRFLHYLTARLDDQPILLAVTTDPGERGHQAQIVRAIVSHPAARMVRLAPLSEARVRAHIGERLGDEADPRLVDACYQATGGIPFLLHELLGEIATARQHGEDFPPQRVFDLAPPKVVGCVRQLLSSLPPAAVALVEAMAVLGAEADLRHAIDVAGIDQRHVAEALGALADTGLLHPGVPPRFVYPTVGAAVYQNMLVSARNAAHAQAARFLASAAAPLDDIAQHLLRADVAGDPAAVTLLRRAAAKAVADNCAPDAVTYLTRALQEPPEQHDVVPLLTELGRAELRAQSPKGLDHLGQAMGLSDDAVVRGRIGLDLAPGLVAAGRIEEAVTLLEALRAEAGDRDEQLGTLLDIALITAAQQVTFLRCRGSRRLYQLARSGSTNPGVTRLLAVSRATRALRQGASVDVVTALAEEALSGMLSEDFAFLDHDVSAYLWWGLGSVLACCDRLADADRLLSRTLSEAQASGMLLAATIYHSLRSWVRLQCGRLADAEADARTALEHASPFGFCSPAAVLAVASLSEVLTMRGEFGAARTLLNEYDFDASVKQSGMYPPLLFARGRLQAATGDLDAAVEDFSLGCQLMDDWDVDNPALLYAAEAVVMLTRAGRQEEARDRAEALLPRARAFGAPRVLAAALRASALAATDGMTVAHLEQAAELLAGTEARLEHATVLVDLGTALRYRDRPATARRRLTSGMEAAQDCGAWGLVKSARAELSAMGVRVRLTEEGVDSLTVQERRVADLAAEGKRNRDIALTLFVTVKTVEWHLNRVYRKLGIASRDELRRALAPEYVQLGASALPPSRCSPHDERASPSDAVCGSQRSVPEYRRALMALRDTAL